MAEPNWLRHVLHIGGFEFKRTVRAIWQDKARTLLLTLGLVIPSLMLAGFVFLFSGAIREAGPITLPPVARGTVAMLWLFGVFIATQRVVSARPRIDAEPLMLTMVSARTVVGGLLVAETLRVLAYLSFPVVVLTAGAVSLFGSPASLVLIPLAAVLFGFTAVLVGMVLGYAIALLIATSPFVARHKTILGGAAALLAMGGYLLMTLPQFGGVGQEALAELPVGWLVDLAVLGSPIRGSVERTVAVVVGSLVVLLVGVTLVEREATRLWFTDAVEAEESRTASPDRSASDVNGTRTALADAIAPIWIPQVVSRPTRQVAQWAVLRTRRDPRRLNFLLLPVIMVGSGLLSSGMQAGSLWSILAPAAAVLLPWMAGATFAMNPFGDEGAVLPITLVSISGPAYVRGLMLPGLLLGGPVVVLGTAGAALVGQFHLSVVAGLIGVAILVTIVAVTTAPAVGFWAPRFSAISIGQSREVVPPRLLTTAVHFVGVTVPGALLAIVLLDPQLARALVAGLVGFLPAIIFQGVAGDDAGVLADVGAWFHGVGTGVQSLGILPFQLASGSLFVLGGIVVATLSYRLAVLRFGSYTPPT